MGLIGDYGIAEGAYGARIIELTRAFGAWPDAWSAPLTPLYELEHRYREALVAPEHRDLLELKAGTRYSLETYILDYPDGKQVLVTVDKHPSEGEVPYFRLNGKPGELAVRTNVRIGDDDIVIDLVLDPKQMRIIGRKAEIVKREFIGKKHVEQNTALNIHNITILGSQPVA